MDKLNVSRFIESCLREAERGFEQMAFDRLFEVLTDTSHQSDDWLLLRAALHEFRAKYAVG